MIMLSLRNAILLRGVGTTSLVNSAKINPVHTKKGIDQVPQHFSVATKQKKVISRFLLFFAQVTPIQDIPSRPFQLVKSQNFAA